MNQTTPLASPALYVLHHQHGEFWGGFADCFWPLPVLCSLCFFFSAAHFPVLVMQYIQRWGREHETNYEVRSNTYVWTEMLLIPLSTGSYKKTCIIGVSYNNIFMTKHYNNVLATHFPHRYLYLGVSIKH